MNRESAVSRKLRLVLALLLRCLLVVGASVPAFGQAIVPESPSAREIIERVNLRSFGQSVTRKLELRLIDPGGQMRERGLVSFRSFEPDASYLAFYVTSPPDMRHTAYLVHDYFDPEKPDGQWYYSPKAQAARPIPQLNLAEAFLGSELTLEDVKKIYRIEIDQYDWKLLGEEELAGRKVYKVEQRPRTEKLAKGLRVSRMINYVDKEYWVRVKVEVDDLAGKPYKVIEIVDVEIADQAPRVRVKKLVARNLQNGRRTEVRFLQSRYDEPIKEEVFSVRGMERQIVR